MDGREKAMSLKRTVLFNHSLPIEWDTEFLGFGISDDDREDHNTSFQCGSEVASLEQRQRCEEGAVPNDDDARLRPRGEPGEEGRQAGRAPH